jgi:hypothetical protein
LSQLPAQLRQALHALRVEPPSCAEQVGPAGDVQALGDGCPQPGIGAGERALGDAGLRPCEIAQQGSLGLTRCVHDSPAQGRQLGCPRVGGGPEAGARRVEEAVALADQAVEVGQRLYLRGLLGPVVRDDGEPEPQLG